MEKGIPRGRVSGDAGCLAGSASFVSPCHYKPLVLYPGGSVRLGVVRAKRMLACLCCF